MTDKLNKI